MGYVHIDLWDYRRRNCGNNIQWLSEDLTKKMVLGLALEE